MEDKYQEIYKQLKEEAKNTLESSSTEKFIDEFKAVVRERLSEIHKKLDVQKDIIIGMATDVYNKEIELIKSSDESDKKKKETKKESKKDEEEEVKKEDLSKEALENLEFKQKIKGLIGNLQNIISKTDSLEETVKVFKEDKLSKLIEIKDNDFKFKYERKLKFKLQGKTLFDLGWAKDQNKPVNSDVDKDDETVLNVHSNSCYNYFVTNNPIKDDIVRVVLETDISKTDGYFYFGVTTPTQVFNSYCMCCTCAGVTYIKSNGYYVQSSTSTVNTNLKFESTANVIEITVDAKEKKCYFKVNDFDEQGPYNLPTGEEFLITSGSCNTANGKIKIVSSMVIG